MLTEKEKKLQKTAVLTAMKILSMNQSQLAVELEVNPSQVCRWIKGKTYISSHKAIRLHKLVPELKLEHLAPALFKG
jgi:plasmid maintenance system antidote protein VapI